VREAHERLKVLEVLRSQQSVPQLLVLAHLVPVAEAPAVDTEVLAIRAVEVDL